MADISSWSTTAASNNAAVPDGAPEGWRPSEVNNWGREQMAAIRRWYEDAEWIDWGHTLTYISGTQFSTAAGDGDTTAIYHVGRRIRATISVGGPYYGKVTASSHSTVTTVTVSLNGAMDASLSEIAVGLLSADNISYPSDLNGEPLIMDADGDTSIAADTDDQIDVEIGGADKIVITAAAFDLTDLSIDGDAEIPFDQGIVVGSPATGSKGTGTVNAASGVYHDGDQIAGLILLDTQNPSASADVTFTTASWFSSTWAELILVFDGVYPSTSGANAWLRLSQDGGSTWDAGTLYRVVDIGTDGSGSVFSNANNHDRIGLWGDAINSAASGGAGAKVSITGFLAASSTMVRADATWARVTASISGNSVWAYHNATATVDGIQFLFNTGTIGGGAVRLYGVLA